MSKRNLLFKKYSQLPPLVHKATDPLIKVGYRVSPFIESTQRKSDAWISKKKSQILKKR